MPGIIVEATSRIVGLDFAQIFVTLTGRFAEHSPGSYARIVDVVTNLHLTSIHFRDFIDLYLVNLPGVTEAVGIGAISGVIAFMWWAKTKIFRPLNNDSISLTNRIRLRQNNGHVRAVRQAMGLISGRPPVYMCRELFAR